MIVAPRGDARDRAFEHLNGQSGQRPICNAEALRWIVSRVGVIKVVTRIAIRRVKVRRRVGSY